jgi:quercetin dioxygenase-like cupin family protein
VLEGRASLRVGEEERQVTAGCVVNVDAGVEHGFHGIEEDLRVLVVFSERARG